MKIDPKVSKQLVLKFSNILTRTQLPSEIQHFFTPFPLQIEQFFATAQFQYCALADKINSQSLLIDRLVQKINKQKSLLLLAKEKVSQIDSMEKFTDTHLVFD